MIGDDDDDYDFYPCLVDHAPASIYLNLRYEHATPAAASTAYWVAVSMIDPGPHGIGTAEEAVVLDAFEEELIARAHAAQLVYVGRIRSRGVWETTFYGPAGHVDILRAGARELLGRRTDVRSEPDPEWSYYRDLLLPDAERRRWMADRRLVQVLKDQGDVLVTPRRVDHRASFASADALGAFVAAAVGHGFTRAEASGAPPADRPFGAQVSRIDPIELDHIHDVVMILVDAATAHGGAYDGWLAGIESA